MRVDKKVNHSHWYFFYTSNEDFLSLLLTKKTFSKYWVHNSTVNVYHISLRYTMTILNVVAWASNKNMNGIKKSWEKTSTCKYSAFHGNSDKKSERQTTQQDPTQTRTSCFLEASYRSPDNRKLTNKRELTQHKLHSSINHSTGNIAFQNT